MTPHARATELWLIAQEIFERFPDAIIIVDEQMHIRHVNQRAIELFGYGGEIDGKLVVEEEMIGKPVTILMPLEAATVHPTYTDEYLKNPQARPMGLGLVIQGQRRLGAKFHCEIALTPLERSDPTQRRILARIIPRDPPPHITLVTKVEELEKALAEAKAREKPP